jgi:WD40 repeat protein
LRFDPSNEWLVSGSLDTNVYIWNVVDPGQKRAIRIPNAGMGGVHVVEWVGPNTILSAGADASLKTWELAL